MCGLVGMAGNLYQPHKKMFRDMLVFDQVRGFDSTGVSWLTLKHKAQMEYVKDIGPAQNLWDYDVDKVFTPRGLINDAVKILMGHNRAATIGNVTVDNAHPFTYKGVTGAHNGSLRDWKDLEGFKDFDVDSKALINDIAHHGIDKTWEKFCGAAALSLYDENKEELMLIRNEERPLYTCWNISGDVLFWASEKWMIWVAASRNAVKLKINGETKEPDIKPLPVNEAHIYKTTSTNCRLDKTIKVKKKPYIGKKTGTTGVGGQNVYNNNTYKQSVGFSLISDWKKDTVKSNLPVKDCKFRNFRRYSMYMGQGKGHKDIFKVDIYDDKDGYLGMLNIIPTNQSEFTRLSNLSSFPGICATKEVVLKSSPRRRKTKKDYSAYYEYVCSASLVDFVDKDNKVVYMNPTKKEEKEEPKLYMNNFGKLCTKEELQALFDREGGCCCTCSDPLDVEDHKEINWFDGQYPMCPICKKEWGRGTFLV